MKLKGIKILTFLIAVFGFIGIANATPSFVSTGSCDNRIGDLDKRCELSFYNKFKVMVSGEEFDVIFNQAGNIDGAITITASPNFVIVDEGVEKDSVSFTLQNDSDDEKILTFKYKGTVTLPISEESKIVLATATYRIISGSVPDGAKCGFNYGNYAAAVCAIVPDKDGIVHYFDINKEHIGVGDEAKAAYYKSCFYCLKPGETNKNTNKTVSEYYGVDGRLLGTDETAKTTYEDECTTPTYVCKIDKDGNYYGPEGTKVTEDEFYKQCYSCKKDEDGKYRGLDGKETTEEEFLKQCYSCKKDDEGKYHDKEGKVITEEEYKKICEPTCRYEKKNGKYVYYDFDGKEISKEEYAKICPGDVPTGSFLPIAGIIGGIALIGFASFLVKKQTKIKNI